MPVNEKEVGTLADDGLVLTPFAQPVARPGAPRISWPDVSRGIGIVLVVIGHAIGGLNASGAIGPQSPWLGVFYLIYTFHMPLFFVLSGLFIKKRLEHRSSAFLKRGLIHNAWPYFVWGSIQFIIITQLGSVVNAPYPLRPDFVLHELWSPPSQFWFLYVLFVVQIIYWLLMPIVGDLWLLGAAVVIRLLSDVVTLPSTMDDVCRYAVFIAVGVSLGPRLLQWLASLRRPGLVAIGATVLWSIVAVVGVRAGLSALGLLEMPAAFLGSLAVVAAASAKPLNTTRWIAYLGRRSMPVYLLHVLFVAGTRIGLRVVLGVTSASIVLPFAVLIGIVAPLVIFEIANHFRATRLLALG